MRYNDILNSERVRVQGEKFPANIYYPIYNKYNQGFAPISSLKIYVFGENESGKDVRVIHKIPRGILCNLLRLLKVSL
jgi:hypothetical protein